MAMKRTDLGRLLGLLMLGGGCGGAPHSAAAPDSFTAPDASTMQASSGDKSSTRGSPGASQGSGTESRSTGSARPAGLMGMDAQLVPSSHTIERPELDGVVFPEPGQTEFVTAAEVAEGSWAGTPTRASAPSGAEDGIALGAASEAVGAPAPSADTAMQAATQAPSAEREIVEADVVQMHGDVLYVLNRFRGLVLVDMSDPDSPYVMGRLPFQAKPVDMYVRDGRAYIVMSDYFAYYQWDDDADPRGFHGSQILVVDIVDPTQPAEIGSFNVEGAVTDTRIVGDVLYAVSSRNPEYWRYDTYAWQDTTWVLSINLADPGNIHEVDRVEFSGASNLIQVYATALSIAAIDPNYFIVDEDNAKQTKITYVDISDPGGDIHVGGSAYVEGTVADKFKMDYVDGYLRVISQDWYWNAEAPAQLYVFDARSVDTLDQVAQLPVAGDVVGATGYTRPRATRFSGDKLFVNLCWTERSPTYFEACRLDFYNLETPDAPAKVGELPVDGGIHHFEVRGDRLVALGDHNITDLVTGTRTSKVQIALYDISSLASTSLLSAVDLGESSSSTAAAADYKAFKLVEDLNLILLPLSWREQSVLSRFRYHNGAQLVDWEGDRLTARGTIEHHDAVERVVSFKDRVLVISPRQLQVVDVANRDAPRTTARMFLVRNVVDVFDMQGYQVQLGYDEQDASFRFFVLPFGEDDMANSVAELPIEGQMFYHLRSGDLIRMIGYDPAVGKQVIRNADFSDPLNPRWRGEYAIPDEIQHIWNGGGGYYGYHGYYDWYWNPSVGQPLNNDLLPATVREAKTDTSGRRFFINHLQLIDLRDPDQPRLAQGKIEMPDYPFVNQVTHGSILYSTHTEPALDEDGNELKYSVRYFLDRVDAADPDNLVDLGSINIPGRLVDVDDSGSVLYTVDYQWDDFGRRRNSLDVLKLEGSDAVLKTVLPVGDEIGRARYTDREVWLTSHKYPWWGRNDETPDSRQPYTLLSRVQVAESAEIEATEQLEIWGYHFNLLDIDQDQAILSTGSPSGLMVVDTEDLAMSRILTAARTVGYVSKVVRHDGYLYMPMGLYGVHRLAF